MTKAEKCRSCLSYINESNALSIYSIGHENYTFKEMFETSIGYEILPTEPQFFCDFCVQNLIKCFSYKALCKETQDKLLRIPIKREPQALKHSESVWCEEISIEPELKVETDVTIPSEISQTDEIVSQPNSKTTPLSLPYSINGPFEVEFSVYIRNFWSQSTNKIPLGKLNVVGLSTHEFLNQIWLFVKPHLKREIVFINRTPAWHPDEHPQKHQVMDFITIKDPVRHKNHESESTLNFRCLQKKKLSLFIHPYSKNIKLRTDWQIAQTLLFLEDETSTKKQEEESNRLNIVFELFIRNHVKLHTKHGIKVGILRIEGSTVDELMSQIWNHVKKHLKHEIIFNENGDYPIWHPDGKPQEKDLLRFIVFKDDLSKLYLTSPSLYNFKAWTKSKPAIHIFPYSKNISSKIQWKECQRLISGYSSSSPEPSKLLLSVPPVSTVKKIKVEKKLTLSKKEYVDGDMLHIEFNMYLQNYLIFHQTSRATNLGILKIQGSTVDELKKQMWDFVKEYLVREIIFDKNGENPTWHEDEIPQEKNLHRFISYTDNIRKKRFGDPSLRQFILWSTTSRNINVSILPYSKNIKSNSHWKLVRNMISKKRKTQKNTSTDTVNEPIICDVCGIVVSNKYGLNSHWKLKHGSSDPYLCEHCPMEFKYKKTLKDHVLRCHIGLELKYNCEKCSYKTHRRRSFRDHIKYNHDPNYRKLSCPQCGKKMSRKSVYHKHLKTHNTTGCFECNVCNHVCRTEIALKAHMTLHLPWRYECPVCEIKRRSSHEVRMHMIRKHPEHKLPPKYQVLRKDSKLRGYRMRVIENDDENIQ